MLDKQLSWHSNCYGETSWNMTITHGSLFFSQYFQIKPTSTKKTESGCHVNTEDFFKNQSLSPCRTWQHLAHHPSKMQMELIGRIAGWSALIHQSKRNTSALCGMYKVSSGIYRKYWDWARKNTRNTSAKGIYPTKIGNNYQMWGCSGIYIYNYIKG